MSERSDADSDLFFRVICISQGQKLFPPEVIFDKVEDQIIDQEIQKLKGRKMKDENLPMTSYPPLKEEISFKDFDKVDMRVGLVSQAHKIEKSNKLLKIEVDLGFEKRQIISGIAKSISPDALIGKKVILVANLKPVKIMGHESQGMILAVGEEESGLEIPFVIDKEKGDIVC